MKKLYALALCIACFSAFNVSASTMGIKVVLEGETLIEEEADFTFNEFERIGVAQTDGSIYIFSFKVTEDGMENEDIPDIEKSVTIYALLSKQKPDGTLELIGAPQFNTPWNEKALLSLANNATGKHLSTFMVHPKK